MAFYNADEVGADSAIGRRSSTIGLIQEFVSNAGAPVTQAQIREGLFHGRISGSGELEEFQTLNGQSPVASAPDSPASADRAGGIVVLV